MKFKIYLIPTLFTISFFSLIIVLKLYQNPVGTNAVVEKSENNQKVLGEAINISPTPYIKKPRYIGREEKPDISAYSALAVDLDSGMVIYEKNQNLRLYPASTTKIVTALVAFDYYDLEKPLQVDGLKIDGQKMNLVRGEVITVNNLLYGLLMYSANDAAEVLAENFPGGRENFVSAMNLKVKQLGLKNTYFDNPIGFDGSNQYTTASDLLNISKALLDNSLFKEIVGTKVKIVEDVEGNMKHKLTNLNELLGEVEGVKGIKTGWTENAKENLVSFIERGNRKIILVILGSNDRFGESKTLISWMFNNYSWE